MQTIHTLVAVPLSYFEGLAGSLPEHFNIEIVDLPFDAEKEEKQWIITDAVKTRLETDITVDDHIVLVTDSDEPDGIPAFFERLLIEFPELTIMGICRNRSVLQCFQLQIHVQELGSSLSELSEAIQACAHRAMPW